MKIELTQASEKEYNNILCGRFTPAMAAEYLKEGQISLRTFGEVLQEIYPQKDLVPRLVAAFMAEQPVPGQESVQRRIRNWFSGSHHPTNREDIFRIAFALDLTEAQTDYLLGLCTGYGIHYREGRDLVYSWFLRTGRNYGEAKKFLLSLPPLPRYDQVPARPDPHITRELQNTFAHIQTEEALRACYLDNLENFGLLHMRAYAYFEKYLQELIHPASPMETMGTTKTTNAMGTMGTMDTMDGASEPDYSLEYVMNVYLSLNMPSGKRRSGYSVIQKLIKQNWPNATALKNIRSHKEDVPRKLLLLLYVITENILEDDYNEMDEEYITPEERMEDHWWTLNAILTDCGMPLLDPRNATDWLILYAIASTDEPMSERFEKVIECIFSDAQ